MFYILINPDQTLVYPYTLTDLIRNNRHISFPSDMSKFDTSPFNCYPVVPTPEPIQDNMVAVRIMPELIDNVWYERWELQPAPPKPVPQSVTMRQARLALLQYNLLSQVDTAISNIEDEFEREQAKITWEYSTEVQRSHPMIENLGEQFRITTEQLDELFILASTL